MKDFNKHMKSIGVTVLGKLDSNGARVQLGNIIPATKAKIFWICSVCKEEKGPTNMGSVANTGKCKSCGIRVVLNVPTVENFKKLLEDKSWELIDEEANYKNTKTLMKVLCSGEHGERHKTTTTYNRFQQDHGCKKCANISSKWEIGDVIELFKTKNMDLLEEEYKNNQTDMKYLCKCGQVKYITLSNFYKNIVGCGDCAIAAKRVPYQCIEDLFEDFGCSLNTKEQGDKTKNSFKNIVS